METGLKSKVMSYHIAVLQLYVGPGNDFKCYLSKVS